MKDVSLYVCRLKRDLYAVQQQRLTAETLPSHWRLYNALAKSSYDFFSRVVLLGKKNRCIIKYNDLTIEEAADECVMCFLTRLDRVLVVMEEKPACCIGFIVNMVNNKLIDIARARSKRRRTLPNKKRVVPSVLTLSDEAWNLIENTYDLAATYEINELIRTALTILSVTLTPLEAIAVLAKPVMHWQPAQLAERLICDGWQPVMAAILKETAALYHVEMSVLDDIMTIAQRKNYDERFIRADAVNLAKDLSEHQRYNGVRKLRAALA